MKKLHYFLSIVLTVLLLTGVQKQNFAQAKSFGGELIVKIGLAAKPNVDDITFQFIENGTEEFNGDYDAYKMFGGPANPYLYILVEDQGFQSEVAVKAFPLLSQNRTIKLGIKTEISGNQNYVMNFEKLNTIDEQVQIYLKDLILNDSVDLRANGSYTFQSAPFYNNERFEIKFYLASQIEAVVSPEGPVYLCEGMSADLTANTGAGFTYQWYNNDELIEGETNNILAVSEPGKYFVEITAPEGTATSNIVDVMMFEIPEVFLEGDQEQTFCEGDSLLLHGYYLGDLEGIDISYVWYANDVLIEGAVETSLWVKEGNINYNFGVVHQCGETLSEPVTVNQVDLPFIVINDTIKYICEGDSTLLIGNNWGKANLSFEWYKDEVLIEGAIDTLYWAKEPGSYSIMASNECGQSLSKNCIIEMTDAPLDWIVMEPQISKLCQGDSVLIKAEGGGLGVTFQWYKNDEIIVAATNEDYWVKEPAQYKVVVQNSCGSIEAAGCPMCWAYYPMPVINMPADTVICDTVKLMLDAGPGWVHYKWSNDSTSQIIFVDTLNAPAWPQVISVWATDSNGCKAYAEIIVRFEKCTGINNINASVVNLYPNPNKGLFTLKNCDAFETIEIFNLAGQRIYNEHLTTSIVDINLGTINKGLYILKATGNKGSIYKKIVVE